MIDIMNLPCIDARISRNALKSSRLKDAIAIIILIPVIGRIDIKEGVRLITLFNKLLIAFILYIYPRQPQMHGG